MAISNSTDTPLRPSNARIEILREENEALQAQLQGQQSRDGFAPTRRTQMHTQSSETDPSSPSDRLAVQERIERPTPKSAQGATISSDAERTNPPTHQFHGPTSAMYDITPQSDQTMSLPAAISEVYQKAQLTAETAKQRTFLTLSTVCTASVTS